MTATIFYLLGFRFFRFRSARSTSDLGTRTSARASWSNAFQPLGFLAIVVTPLLGDSHESRVVNRCQNTVGKSLADNLPERLKESVEIAHQAVIESEGFLVRVAENVPRREGDISSFLSKDSDSIARRIR
jgi:hypothetical protein